MRSKGELVNFKILGVLALCSIDEVSLISFGASFMRSIFCTPFLIFGVKIFQEKISGKSGFLRGVTLTLCLSHEVLIFRRLF